MATNAFTAKTSELAADKLRHRGAPLVLAAVLFGLAALLLPVGMGKSVLFGVSITLFLVTAGVAAHAIMDAIGKQRSRNAVIDLVEYDTAPSFVTEADGLILYANAAARDSVELEQAKTLAAALGSSLSNPGAILFRLETRAEARGSAQEDVVTRSGHMRISVHQAGEARFLWRVETRAGASQSEADSVQLPMITVGRHDAVLFMNAAAREMVGERARSLDRICPRLPIRSGQVNDISTRDGILPCFVVELDAAAGRREIFLLPHVIAPQVESDSWALFDELPVPLLKVSVEGEVRLANRPARHLLGIDAKQVYDMGDLVEGLGRSLKDWLAEAAEGRGALHSEFLRAKRDDQETYVQVTLNRVVDEGETVLIVVLSDATELKSLEAQFVQSQKMQAIGQLAGGVAHDFNNLLTAITGHCDLLLLRHDPGDPDYSDLTQIHQNANRAAALVGQLLAFSRKQTLRPETIDLRETLSDLIHLLNRLVGEKVTLTLSHEPSLQTIRADKRQLEQVLMNLVVNARDAMPEGGDIRIETANLHLDAPLRRDRAVVAPGDYVTLRVIDQGVGISQDKLQKVFEPFFTTKRVGEGTGLGLSTAYGIIKQTGGFIFVDSEVGKGSVFHLVLPAFETEAVPEADVAVLNTNLMQREGVVLLVEDEAPVRAFASRALQLRGLTVYEADCAEEALRILEDDSLEVDVFVTDVIMPGVDGPTWVREALETRPDTRVVFVSGYAEETFADDQRDIPNSTFLPKPFSLTELTETVLAQLTQLKGAA